MSRIHVYSWEMEGFSVPTTCQHCEDAPCVGVCPTGAMHEDKGHGTVACDTLKCIGCRMCTLACPFGAVVFDTERRRIVKCDMCGGDPECARFCPVKAIEYVDEGDAGRTRKKAVAVEFKKTFEEVS